MDSIKPSNRHSRFHSPLPHHTSSRSVLSGGVSHHLKATSGDNSAPSSEREHGAGDPGKNFVLSEKEKKIFRDAFELFDTDGDGSVTKTELKHVMETLFDKQLKEAEVEQMIADVDTDNDGEISFDEFTSKVAEVINNLKNGEGEGRSESDEHWNSLSRLISHFSDQEGAR